MSRTPELKSWLPDMVAQMCKVLHDPEKMSNNLTYGRYMYYQNSWKYGY